jgi:hypothetical protein
MRPPAGREINDADHDAGAARFGRERWLTMLDGSWTHRIAIRRFRCAGP